MKIDKADRWFSIFIRLRDSDENGICRCVTCKTSHYWKLLDCGHFVKRQHQATRFNEKNCAAQCKKCNGFEQGRDSDFEKFIIDKYGEQTVDLLKSGERQSFKRSKFEKELLAKEYQQKAIELAKEKGIKI
jgi:uncharacterized Rmd1/YagE family protein